MRQWIKFVSVIIILSCVILVSARSFRINEIPNGNINACANCHISPGGGGARDNFGKLVETRFLTEPGMNGHVIWNALLASYDADNDGVPNGEELQDRFAAWAMGNPQPGNPSLVTDPAESSDNPLQTLTLNFSGMNPHVGQQLEIRVVDKSTGKESGRTEVSSIPGASFTVDMDAILVGHSYFIDFYADFNGNSLYDAPPADHAWRLELDDVQGNTTVPFAHNTNFTDIEWVYLLTVQFTGMTPHVNQLLELRVVNQSSSAEVGRTRVEFIPGSDFTLEVAGIHPGEEYRVDFYADLNGNFLYNPPPADHAWRETFNNTTGDFTINFAHNTNFTDVEWNYLFTINLLEMTPHLGQLFELRVVDETTGNEVGRTRLDNILVKDFVTTIPGILPGNNYRADFYADLNGNGTYDPPPADHAWRVLFSNNTGNVAENFTHNTNFTDIQWPPIVGIDVLSQHAAPEDFTLFQNYPNPFNPQTRIRFNIARTEQVTLDIYNSLGQRVRVLVNETLTPASYEITWDGLDTHGRQLSSGIYFYRLRAGGFQQVNRMFMMK